MPVDARLLVRAGMCAAARWGFDPGAVTLLVVAHAADAMSLTRTAEGGGEAPVETVRMEVLTAAEGQVRVGYGPESRTLVVEMPAPGLALLPRRVD